MCWEVDLILPAYSAREEARDKRFNGCWVVNITQKSLVFVCLLGEQDTDLLYRNTS